VLSSPRGYPPRMCWCCGDCSDWSWILTRRSTPQLLEGTDASFSEAGLGAARKGLGGARMGHEVAFCAVQPGVPNCTTRWPLGRHSPILASTLAWQFAGPLPALVSGTPIESGCRTPAVGSSVVLEKAACEAEAQRAP